MERKDLEARSARFAEQISDLCGATSPGHEPRGPLGQLLDCATAVGANYRASSRARSRREFVAKLGVVAEEADEAVYWLEFLKNTRRGDPTMVSNLLEEARELRNIFAASYRTARQRNRPSGQRGDGGQINS
jgi:four helix bundle protein